MSIAREIHRCSRKVILAIGNHRIQICFYRESFQTEDSSVPVTQLTAGLFLWTDNGGWNEICLESITGHSKARGWKKLEELLIEIAIKFIDGLD